MVPSQNNHRKYYQYGGIDEVEELEPDFETLLRNLSGVLELGLEDDPGLEDESRREARHSLREPDPLRIAPFHDPNGLSVDQWQELYREVRRLRSRTPHMPSVADIMYMFVDYLQIFPEETGEIMDDPESFLKLLIYLIDYAPSLLDYNLLLSREELIDLMNILAHNGYPLIGEQEIEESWRRGGPYLALRLVLEDIVDGGLNISEALPIIQDFISEHQPQEGMDTSM